MRSDTKHMQGILEAYGYIDEASFSPSETKEIEKRMRNRAKDQNIQDVDAYIKANISQVKKNIMNQRKWSQQAPEKHKLSAFDPKNNTSEWV